MHPVLSRLTAPDITREDYSFIITRFFGFYAPLEKAYAASHHPELKDYPNGKSVENLHHDLLAQGIEPDALPVEAPTPDALSLEQAAGYLYLREGSALGGQVISKHLEKNLGLRSGEQNRFFYGAGKETGPSWKLFMATLETIENRVDIEKTARYSAELFARLESWMRREKSS